MEISKETRKRMMQIIAFGILLYCGMEHFDVVIGAVSYTHLTLPTICSV